MNWRRADPIEHWNFRETPHRFTRFTSILKTQRPGGRWPNTRRGGRVVKARVYYHFVDQHVRLRAQVRVLPASMFLRVWVTLQNARKKKFSVLCWNFWRATSCDGMRPHFKMVTQKERRVARICSTWRECIESCLRMDIGDSLRLLHSEHAGGYCVFAHLCDVYLNEMPALF